jgi:predicted Ser/Thr protein kinase
MVGGPRSPGSVTTRADGTPTADDPLRRASPPVDDVERRRARAAIESKLFSGPPQPVRVGRYRVLGRIGSGGMGVVYRAHDPELARDVAVKVVNPETGAGHEHARARLVREARAMARLAHPNVIHVYDVGTVEDGVFIAMELVEGSSLAAWLQAEPRPWRQILEMFVHAGRGLAAAHAAGVIHRDFKPHNVLVGTDGRVRVGDFGLAGGDAAGPTGPHEPVTEPIERAQEEPAALDRASISGALTRTGMLLGTPKYMPPEQESGAPASARSDQFSFCVALYEALYGRPPYAGDSVSVYRHHVRHGDVLPPPEGSRVRAWVHAEIVRGLSVDPAERHPGMDALLDRLDDALEDPRALQRRRRRLRLTGIGAIAAGVSALVMWRVAGGQGEVTPAEPQPALPVVMAAAEPPVAVPTGAGVAEGQATAGVPPVEAGATEPTLEGAGSEAADGSSATEGATERKTTAQASTTAQGRGPVRERGGATGKAAARPEAKPDKRGNGVCYFIEDKFSFIGSTTKAKKHLLEDGRCWDCTRRASEHQIAGLDPNDCAAYYLCVEEPIDKCTE